MDDRAKKVLDSLQGLCSRQECCTSDLLGKAVRRLDGDRAAAEEVVQALVADGFADNRRFAAVFAREKASITGWGPVKIRQALAAKGIPREAIDEALPEIDSERASAKLHEYSAVEDLVAGITGGGH